MVSFFALYTGTKSKVLKIYYIFLWPISSSWSLESGKMAAGIIHSMSWAYLAYRAWIIRLWYITANTLQILATLFFICPTCYLWKAHCVLGKEQSKQTLLSLLPRDLSANRIITESQILLFLIISHLCGQEHHTGRSAKCLV